ncbi:hypothetical protein AURDEDRAFT_163748 [Auricularia subglabra TFB-10046 SS5]|nr:hypothetical protein AURDEDRAFT_163748 [Auricularia subglabra TFB-10046 SS5]
MHLSLVFLATAAGLAAAQTNATDTVPQCVAGCITLLNNDPANADVGEKCGAITDGVKTLQCICQFDKIVDAYQKCFDKACAGVADAAQLNGKAICKNAGSGAPAGSAGQSLPGLAATVGLVAACYSSSLDISHLAVSPFY